MTFRVDCHPVMPGLFAHWSHCYGCSRTNQQSEGLVLEPGEDSGVVARVHIDRDRGGAPGFAHGGYLSFLLDEVMGGVGGPNTRPRVTTDMNVRFRRAVPLESDVVVSARLESSTEEGFTVLGTITVAPATRPSVEATATFRYVDLDRLRQRA